MQAAASHTSPDALAFEIKSENPFKIISSAGTTHRCTDSLKLIVLQTFLDRVGDVCVGQKWAECERRTGEWWGSVHCPDRLDNAVPKVRVPERWSGQGHKEWSKIAEACRGLS